VLPTLADTNRNLSNILGILDIDSTEYRRDWLSNDLKVLM
jgi:hypothetical protein